MPAPTFDPILSVIVGALFFLMGLVLPLGSSSPDLLIFGLIMVAIGLFLIVRGIWQALE